MKISLMRMFTSSDAIDLAQEPRKVQAKGRPKGSYGKGKANTSTERDSSHWEVVNSQLIGDGSQLKGIYRQPKKRGRPTGAKPPPKAAAKKRGAVETLDLTADDPIGVIEVSEGGENEGSDEGDQGEEPSPPPPPPLSRKKKAITYFSDSFSDEEASTKRPRRSSYARRAPKNSL
jgi:hypothetical protein